MWFDPRPHKTGMVAHAYNPNAQEVEAGGVQDHPSLCGKFEANMGLVLVTVLLL